MPRTSERGGPQTRARIAEVAAGLFHERGFDAVTVAEIARAAGVSSVTVFSHFPRKEDLFLDRSAEALDLVRGAVRDRAPGTGVLDALRAGALRILDERDPLSGTDPRSVPFFRTVAGSPALRARAREIAADVRTALADELRADATFDGDAALLSALVVGGYATVLVETADRRLGGSSPEEAAESHRVRLGTLFDALDRTALDRTALDRTRA